jgi:hypothetical protein
MPIEMMRVGPSRWSAEGFAERVERDGFSRRLEREDFSRAGI